jgi:hypothetical protein
MNTHNFLFSQILLNKAFGLGIVLPVVGRLKEEDCRFRGSLSYIMNTVSREQIKPNKIKTIKQMDIFNL